MSDLISRADAIDAVAEEWLSEASAESPYVNDDDIGAYRTLAENLFKDVPSAETHEIRTETHECVKETHDTDLISRADAICEVLVNDGIDNIVDRIKALPSADAEQIVYCIDCAKSEPLDEHGALWKCKAHDRTTLRHSYCNNGERKGGDSE